MSRTEKKEYQGEKKKKSRLAYWLVADLLIGLAFVSALLYKPPGYQPLATSIDPNRPQPVHRYLTHLSSKLYNGMQTREPFVIDLLEVGINESILQARWPMESEGITFAAPQVSMTPEGITVVGMASYEGVDLAIRIEGVPRLTQEGQLNLHIAAVRIGALNVTLLARMLARRMVQAELAWFTHEPEDARTQIARSFLEDRPFDPLFEWEDKQVRLTHLVLEKGRVRLTLAPE